MRWTVLLLIVLGLGCTEKKGQPATEPEPSEEPASVSESEPAPEAMAIMDNPELATDFHVDDLPPLPPALGGETPKLGSPPTVTVLEKGKAPHKVLRWSLEPGHEQKLTARLGHSIDAVIVLLQAKMPMTIHEYDLGMKVAGRDGDGTARVTFAVESSRPVIPIEAGSELTEEQKAEAAELTEEQRAALTKRSAVRGSYTLKPNGVVTDFEAVRISDGGPADPGVVDALRWSVLQVTPVLPSEPIGVGAKWTVHEPLIQGGIHAQQLRTFELVSLEGNRVEVSVKVRQNAGPQDYINPLTGGKFELESLNGVAEGSVSSSLASVAPIAADIRSDSLDGAIFRNPEKTRKAGVAVHSKRTVEITAP